MHFYWGLMFFFFFLLCFTIKKDYQYDSQKIGFPRQVQVKMAKGSQRKMIEIKKKEVIPYFRGN